MRIYHFLFLATAILTGSMIANAESLASKNREGNRLFGEGRYEDAEKAYLEAQVNSPGQPEILYNLGNSLIKQEKYTEGIQALRQAAEKENEQVKSDSLYNTGNALYASGDFKGSVEAFIEALKRNPEDIDAKHNLELALQKLQEQEQQQQQGESEDNEKQEDEDADQSGQEGEEQQPTGKNNREDSGGQNNPENPGEMQPEPPPQRESSLTSLTQEQAEQILDAVRNQEMEQQRRLMEARPRSRTDKRDW